MGKAKNSAKQEKQTNYENMTQAFDPREKTLDENKRDILHELLRTKPGFGELVEQFRELIKGDPNTIRALKDLCPESDADGALDFNGMLRAMGAYTSVDVQNDGYVFTWPGKQKAIQLGNEPTDKVLIPDKAGSKHWDTTQNIYIEADNLEALKCLRNTYAGKIKMIYIDPPYNADAMASHYDCFQGVKVSSNGAGNHTKWLNMMYPRLMLARELLSQDGVIFISIDEEEQANLKIICDKVFGMSNRIGEFIWLCKLTGGHDSHNINTMHEYILVYSRSTKVNQVLNQIYSNTQYPYVDDDGRMYKPDSLWTVSHGYTKNCDYPIYVNIDTLEILPYPDSDKKSIPIYPWMCHSDQERSKGIARWFWSKETFEKDYKLLSAKYNNGVIKIYKRIYANSGIAPISIINKDEYESLVKSEYSVLNEKEIGGTSRGKNELKELFDGKVIFLHPKTLPLLNKLIQLVPSDSQILDFFSGSATTAHAVMQLNSEDNGKRKFIMIQMPEQCDTTTSEGKAAIEAGYKTIAEIGKARIDKAGDKIKADNPLTTKDLDIGFRVFRVGESNIPKWWKVGKDAKQLELFENNVKQETESERNDRYRAICYEIMLKHKCLLSAHVDEYLTPKAMEETGGKPLFVVEGGLFICPVGGVNEAWAQAIVKLYESKYKLPPMEELNKDNSWTVIVNDDATTNAMNNDDTRDSDMNRAASTLIDAGLPKGKFLYI